jgi:hypothetical protein
MSDEVNPEQVEPIVEVVLPGSQVTDSRHRAFVRELLSDPERNATQAAVNAGYGNGNRESAKRSAYNLMRRPEIAEEIARREAAADTAAAELIGMRVQCARSAHLGNCITIAEDGSHQIDLKKARDTGALEWIKELSYDRWGRPKIKMVDRLQALDQLDGIFGLKDESRPNEGLEEKRRQYVLQQFNELRAQHGDEAYREARRQALSNPITARYAAELPE